VVAIGMLCFVLAPIFWPSRIASHMRTQALNELPEGGAAIDALREIEFDRATGKLSDADYASLKESYTARALVELRAGGVPAAAPVCPVCGPRPESDALYCSSCATYLSGSCAACGAAVTEPAARYCARCGMSLAA
jgi:hypothetical protein